MKNNIARLDESKGLAGTHVLYLMNMDNGRVFPWTPLLAVRKGFVDCTADGIPINPDKVKGNDSWIMSQTKGLKDRMVNAGATDHTLAEMGRQLSEDAAAKFKSLEYKQTQTLRLGEAKTITGASSDINAGFAGARVRIQNGIEEMVKSALISHELRVLEAKEVLRIR